jgi:hypothetical protein
MSELNEIHIAKLLFLFMTYLHNEKIMVDDWFAVIITILNFDTSKFKKLQEKDAIELIKLIQTKNKYFIISEFSSFPGIGSSIALILRYLVGDLNDEKYAKLYFNELKECLHNKLSLHFYTKNDDFIKKDKFPSYCEAFDALNERQSTLLYFYNNYKEKYGIISNSQYIDNNDTPSGHNDTIENVKGLGTNENDLLNELAASLKSNGLVIDSSGNL